MLMSKKSIKILGSNKILKMVGRIFPRNPTLCQVIMLVLLILFILYELKQVYNKFQKEMRFAFYNEYVNEIYNGADKIRESETKSSNRIRDLTRVLQLVFKKNESNIES